MKKLFFVFGSIFILTAILSFNINIDNTNFQNSEFTIEGSIEGLGNNNLYFQYPNKNYQELGYRADSIIVNDDKFSFKGTTETFELISFYTRIKQLSKDSKSGGYYPTKAVYLLVFISPGANIKVSGKVSDFMDAYPSGDVANDELGSLHSKVHPLLNESVNYMVKASFEENMDLKKVLNQKADSVNQIANLLKKNFIMDNPSSITSAFYLSDMLLRRQINDQNAIAAFNNLNKSLENNSYYKEVALRVKGILATSEGSTVPSIKTISALDGKEFDLESYRGKYVLIDFWGTWCGPCVSEMPKVKEFREKYKGKLEILGVNQGDKKDKMLSFLTQNNYEWQQVMDVKNSETDSFVLKFNVQGFPTKFIIDPNGKILKRYVGSGEEAFILLEELLK